MKRSALIVLGLIAVCFGVGWGIMARHRQPGVPQTQEGQVLTQLSEPLDAQPALTSTRHESGPAAVSNEPPRLASEMRRVLERERELAGTPEENERFWKQFGPQLASLPAPPPEFHPQERGAMGRNRQSRRHFSVRTLGAASPAVRPFSATVGARHGGETPEADRRFTGKILRRVISDFGHAPFRSKVFWRGHHQGATRSRSGRSGSKDDLFLSARWTMEDRSGRSRGALRTLTV